MLKNWGIYNEFRFFKAGALKDEFWQQKIGYPRFIVQFGDEV